MQCLQKTLAPFSIFQMSTRHSMHQKKKGETKQQTLKSCDEGVIVFEKNNLYKTVEVFSNTDVRKNVRWFSFPKKRKNLVTSLLHFIFYQLFEALSFSYTVYLSILRLQKLGNLLMGVIIKWAHA